MKNSNIQWIGDIPDDWEVHPLFCYFSERKNKNTRGAENNLLSLSYGKIVRKDINTREGLLPESFNTYNIVEKDDIIIRPTDLQNDKRSLRTAIAKEHGIITSAYIALKSNNKDVNPDFFHYLLHTYDIMKVFYNMGNGVRQGLNYSEFSKLLVCVPPLPTQTSIATYLDSKCSEIDGLIADINKQIDTLNELKKAKIKECFDKYLSNNKFVYAKLGHLSTLITKQTGFDYSNTISPALIGEYQEGTLPYLQTKFFKDNKFNFETDYYIPEKIARLFPNIVLEKKCLLFSIVGASIGNVAVYPGTCTAFLGGAICKADLINENDYDYIKQYLMSVYGQQQINININSSAQGTITVQNIRDLRIPLFYNTNVQTMIAKTVTELSQEINAIISDKQNQISTLEAYKKSLIYEYVTGKKQLDI